jgi:riboflavin kinase/FMN adenylyltransferase
MGYDHRFGSDRLGSLERYREAAAPLGLEVLAADEYRRADGTAISSSAIRRALAVDGDAAGAALSLGRPYRLSGTVGHGRQIGRTIGFPTANVEGIAAGKVIPAAGVYAATASVDGAAHTAVVNIGSRPTVTAADGSAASRTIEAHLLGFDGDIYSRGITLDFTRRLRDERRFDSLEALSLQIAADIANAAGGQ